VITIEQIGYNYLQNEQFRIDRPTGIPYYLLLLFITEVDIKLAGLTRTVRPYSMMLYEPGYPQDYGNPRTGFVNDWIHFSGDTAGSIIQRLGLPLHEPFFCGNSQEIRQTMRELEMEFRLREAFYEEHIDAQMTAFLIRLARWHKNQDRFSSDPDQVESHARLRSIRSRVLTAYDKPWSLSSMAAIAQLSRSRFCALYSHYFQTSPIRDLMAERFSVAHHLLSSTGLSVQEIAQKVGYDDLAQFSKQFKKTYGYAPSYLRQTRGI